MVEKLTTSGRLSRVETKFAFIETSVGSVFCPLAAAIPATEHVPNFSNRYAVGDMTDNGCGESISQDPPTALSVSKTSLLTNQVVPHKTSKHLTLAFGVSDTHGSVFIPGAAFSAQEVTRLNSYLSIGKCTANTFQKFCLAKVAKIKS
ncbi:unnamed protein product [Strongylus vulgaris]|uniref:Uncharacterized protein n=1 Tax=Strongylus vulgaris TaxID=40348 RepID=A0A3P7JAE6_STRVU|nr:unnamed protein product [Strongylus vulgaris]